MKDEPAASRTTERCVGDVIEFPGTGRVEVRMIEDGEIYFASWKDGTDEPWLARMTLDHFEASLVRTARSWRVNASRPARIQSAEGSAKSVSETRNHHRAMETNMDMLGAGLFGFILGFVACGAMIWIGARVHRGDFGDRHDGE